MADRSQQAHPSDSLTVFAYGSNLCSAWLRGRTPGARVAGTGYLDGFRLEFTKIGRDGSAKATVAPAGGSAAVPGVLYRIPEDEMDALDRAERGYERTFHTIRSA